MISDQLHTLRVITVLASTCIAISCGINYAFSVWGPQFAERMRLSSTQTEMIGNYGNIGMYAIGIPGGAFIDRYGSKASGRLSALLISTGFGTLWYAFRNGPGSLPLWLLCFGSFLNGSGSFMGFNAAAKVCLTNWPQHKGTAMAFPVSAFGLSALVYSGISSILFPDSIDRFLGLATIGPLITIAVSTQFLQMLPPTSTVNYKSVPTDDSDDEPDELLARPAIPSMPVISRRKSHEKEYSLTGWPLLRTFAFWKLCIITATLTGVGLMTINNIGNDAKLLWYHYDNKVTAHFVQQRQLMHVVVLSLSSASGRLASGIGSDLVVKRLHASRLWLFVVSAAMFLIAQMLALTIEDPHYLFLLTICTGIAYGLFFGVIHVIVSDAFGLAGVGFNLGVMYLAPAVSGFFYNTVYGLILDSHASHTPDGLEVQCTEGRSCYYYAYVFTFISTLLGLSWTLFCIFHDRTRKVAY